MGSAKLPEHTVVRFEYIILLKSPVHIHRLGDSDLRQLGDLFAVDSRPLEHGRTSTAIYVVSL